MAPAFSENTDIAIIGGGFSGLVTAWRLAHATDRRTRIVLLEGERPFGAAYATESPWHVLNTPAAKMSALPEAPTHFLRFAESQLGPVPPDSYLPRRLYRRYLATFRDEARDHGVIFRPVAAQSITKEDDRGFGIACSSGGVIHSREIVLAVGAGAPSVPGPLAELVGHPDFFVDPWAPDTCLPPESDKAIALIGTGQTAIDVALELARSGYRGSMTAISRRGLLPGVRESESAPAAALDLDAMPQDSAVALQRWWRAQITAVGCSQTAHALLRPNSGRCWQTLAPRVRARLLRHARPYWEIERHRLAPDVARRLDDLRAAGRLDIVAGRISSASPHPTGITLCWQSRQEQAALARRSFARVINCTGFGGLAGAKASPLLHGLLYDGLVRPGWHDLGVESATDGLHIVGALRRGQSWETTAVPELALQCRDTAEIIRSRLADGRIGAATLRLGKTGFTDIAGLASASTAVF